MCMRTPEGFDVMFKSRWAVVACSRHCRQAVADSVHKSCTCGHVYAMLRMLPRPRGRPRGPYGPSRAATAPLRDFPPLLLPALDACWPRARSQPTCGSELPRRAAFRRPRCASSSPRLTPRARAIPPAPSRAQACSASASEVASTQAWARTIRRLLP